MSLIGVDTYTNAVSETFSTTLATAGSTLARALQQKRPHALGGPLAYIFAECLEQFGGAARIESESGLLGDCRRYGNHRMLSRFLPTIPNRHLITTLRHL